MFVLLHSISGSAFRTLSLNDFLAESSSQIMYSFQSQASLIMLLEEGQFENRRTRVLSWRPTREFPKIGLSIYLPRRGSQDRGTNP